MLFEYARSVLGEQWCEDFGKSKPSTPQNTEDMSKDKLLVNVAKTELLLIGTRQQLAKTGITVGHSVIAPQSDPFRTWVYGYILTYQWAIT